MDARLAGFVDLMARRFHVEPIGRPVDLDLEIARVIASSEGKHAPLFRGLPGGIDGIANLVDTREKVRFVFGVSNDEELYRSLLTAESNAAGGAHTEEVSSWEDEYRAIDSVLDLPLARYYRHEAKRYITSDVIVGAWEGRVNASIHRVSPVGPRKVVARVVPRHLHSMIVAARSMGRELPVAIAWGMHPAVLFAAAMSPPPNICELDMAGVFLGKLKVIRLGNGAVVPYGSTVIMEGFVTLEDAEEGPFVDILGTYDVVRMQPVIRVSRIYVLRDAPMVNYVLPAGAEHRNLMGLWKEAAIWDSVRRVVPQVVAVRLTPGGAGWLHAVVSIRAGVEGDAKNAIMAAFAAHPSLKHVVVVDNDIDVDDPYSVEWAIATRFRADRGLVVVPYARGSTLDPTAFNAEGLTYKVGIDATRPRDRDPRLFERAEF